MIYFVDPIWIKKYLFKKKMFLFEKTEYSPKVNF